MTCIIALKTDDGKVLIGADSAGAGGWALRKRIDPKSRVIKALEASAEFSAGVCAPFIIEELEAWIA